MTNEQFKAIRKKLKLTQVELGKEIGVSRRIIQYYESGLREIPRLVELVMLCKEKEK